MIYTWKVTGIKTRNEGEYQSVVVQTYWTKTGTDEDGNEGVFSGATPFTTSTMPEGSTFVPFSELTEEVVLDWIKAAVVGYENHIDEQIQKQIDQKKAPIEEQTFPWAAPQE